MGGNHCSLTRKSKGELKALRSKIKSLLGEGLKPDFSSPIKWSPAEHNLNSACIPPGTVRIAKLSYLLLPPDIPSWLAKRSPALRGCPLFQPPCCPIFDDLAKGHVQSVSVGLRLYPGLCSRISALLLISFRHLRGTTSASRPNWKTNQVQLASTAVQI